MNKLLSPKAAPLLGSVVQGNRSAVGLHADRGALRVAVKARPVRIDRLECGAGQGADLCSFADGRYVNSCLTNEIDESSFTCMICDLAL